MKIDGECLIEWIGSCRNKVQVFRSVRMPQLHTLLHFHLTPIVMINGSSRRDLILEFSKLLSLHPRRGREPVAVSAVLSTALDICPTRGNLCTPPLPFGRPTPHINCLPETVPWPVQVVRIFTDMSISPSLSPRQCPDCYAFRAGRNLPDNEFCYLRTVIVTATVHRSFGRWPIPFIRWSPASFTFRHWAGVSPHTWSYDFAETCVFGKQSPGLGHFDPPEGAPLLPKLQGYFAEFLRESCLAPLGILYLPTCVGFGYRYPFVEGRSSFSWEYGMGYFSAVAPGTRT
ncbi:hypothetical protein Cgig2_003034 [Carnegiea gigantea]|uniref:Uncharacterized protein n=1 Tax=Carnegiea gigantea TaxID=171969 RepID=A0A9Q1K4H0_9CARY|nr:hypothetical protein Cgig2_003034 [Carnegiea gigantea]